MGSGDGWELLSQAGRMRNGITAGDRRPTIKLLGWQFMEHTVVTVDGICLELRKDAPMVFIWSKKNAIATNTSMNTFISG